MAKGTTNFKASANPELYRAMLELRRSNATQKHDNRPHRQRSRQDAKRAAIRNAW